MTDAKTLVAEIEALGARLGQARGSVAQAIILYEAALGLGIATLWLSVIVLIPLAALVARSTSGVESTLTTLRLTLIGAGLAVLLRGTTQGLTQILVEFDQANLFALTRFPGLDAHEFGTRATLDRRPIHGGR